MHTLHMTAAPTWRPWEELTLRLCPSSPSLTLQLVLRRPPLEQGKVADDVLEKDHLGRRQGGAFLGWRAPPQWQMLLSVAPLCWCTTQVFKSSHSTHRFLCCAVVTVLKLMEWIEKKQHLIELWTLSDPTTTRRDKTGQWRAGWQNTMYSTERMELPQAADQNNITSCDRDNLCVKPELD